MSLKKLCALAGDVAFYSRQRLRFQATSLQKLCALAGDVAFLKNLNFISMPAEFYITGKQWIYAVTNFMEMEDVTFENRNNTS